MATWIVGLIYDLPFRFWWFDVIIHFAGGIWVISAAQYFSKLFGIEIIGNKHVVASYFIALLGAVVLVGVFWEFAEFVFDQYILKTNFMKLSGAIEDTLSDLFFDMAGGVGGIIGFYVVRHGEH